MNKNLQHYRMQSIHERNCLIRRKQTSKNIFNKINETSRNQPPSCQSVSLFLSTDCLISDKLPFPIGRVSRTVFVLHIHTSENGRIFLQQILQFARAYLHVKTMKVWPDVVNVRAEWMYVQERCDQRWKYSIHNTDYIVAYKTLKCSAVNQPQKLSMASM